MNRLFSIDLLDWYDHSKRVLPWRDQKNPYYIWISEIMLQQTQVITVIPYYDRFINAFPTIYKLSEASIDEVLKLWEGLGYYSRARNLHEAAKTIVKKFNGAIPKTYEDIISLKGIGDYTAGAVLSIAFDLPYQAVDGNVLRVFARLLNEQRPIKNPEVKKIIKEQVKLLSPDSRIGDFNQGLMEIGAMICTPSKPDCKNCPIQKHCIANKNNTQNQIPVKQKRQPKPIEDWCIIIHEVNDKIAVRKRPEKGLLGGLYEFIMTQNNSCNKENSIIFDEYVHTFTHKKWRINGYFISEQEELTGYEYVHYLKLNQLAFPNAFKPLISYLYKIKGVKQ
jgi:A/G-specific adenine glycosylase